MFNFLAAVFYPRVSPQLVNIRNVRTGEAFSDTPELAMVRDPKARIPAMGAGTAQARLGPDLTDAQVLSRELPSTGRVSQ